MLASDSPPKPDAAAFKPTLGFLDKVFASRKNRKMQDAMSLSKAALHIWNAEMASRKAEELKLEQQYSEAIAAWQKKKGDYRSLQDEKNAGVDRKRAAYSSRDPDAILDYCDLVLSNLEYPDWMPKDWDLDYNFETKTLVVEYRLPLPVDCSSI